MKAKRTSLISIMVAALAGIAITLYQWLELFKLRSSGDKPLCALNETLNCSAVWDSPLSNSIHQYSGIPVASWGLVWSLLILLLAVKIGLSERQGKATPLAVGALRISAIAGVVGVVLLGLYSISLGVFCLTCIAFYVVVAIIALLTFGGLKRVSGQWVGGAVLSLALTIGLALLLYVPGQRTPLQALTAADIDPSTNDGVASAAAKSDNALELQRFIAAQDDAIKQAMSDFLEEYRHAKSVPQAVDHRRLSYGDGMEPVRLVEWLEITCPHCAQLESQLAQIEQSTPAGLWSIETRYYPLDSECNPNMSRSRNNGVSCMAAKALICIDSPATVKSVRATLFANQKQLSTEMIADILADHDVDMAALDTCLNAESTADTLARDIALAEEHAISGTPLVAINGRALTAMPHLIYALILAGGDDKAAAFSALPSPQKIDHSDHDH